METNEQKVLLKENDYFALDTNSALEKLESSPKGISNEDATARLAKYGRNMLEGKKKESIIIKFLKEFTDILVIILLIAATISIIVDPHEWVESLIILIVVLLNAVLGVAQEAKAEKSLEALKNMTSPLTRVLRDGKEEIVDSKDLVIGDIILVEAGSFVPADARLIQAHNLKVDESSLTGESVPVEKDCKTLKGDEALGDRINMIFSGSFVTYGRGVAVVCGTGMTTEIGKIASMLNEDDKRLTPLQIKLNQIGKVLGFLSIAICVIVFGFQMLAGEKVLSSFETSVALAVAAIPEGLAAIVTIILSIGVNKMVKENAIVKKLPSVETLGCTSIVCSDKTGTLTQNKMTVVEYYDGISYTLEEKKPNILLSYLALCSDAKITEKDGKIIEMGDPTEVALIVAHNNLGTLDLDNYERVAEIPFDSERKLMTVVVKFNNNKYLSITKGAPDQIFNICNNEKQAAIEKNASMAVNALRVLGVGIKEVDENFDLSTLETDLSFVGLVGMIDPERPEVKDSIKVATAAGIKTIMITGDHIITARAIATKLGIFNDGDIAITHDELAKLTDDELLEKLPKISVYARVAPSDKVRIVTMWQSLGQIVAMTGDGVNDAPALKKADIGCAMGITGTDVSKESSDMILTDDNFSTIISAVKEGRNVYSNIKKCVKYLLSSNIGEVLTIFIVSIIALFSAKEIGVPLLPIHLLWINLITDSLPAFSLGMERADDSLMNEKPRKKNESFFANRMGLHICIEGIFVGGLTIAAYFIGHRVSLEYGHTMAFVTLSMTQLFHAFNMKSEGSIISKSTFNNKWLIMSFIIGTALQMGVIYLPGINDIFECAALSPKYLFISLGLAFSIVIIMEVYKAFKKLLFSQK